MAGAPAAVTRPETLGWEGAERDARRAALLVAAFVGVPAAVAAAAALALFAITSLVLLAPLTAAVLAWAAWRGGRPARASSPGPERGS